MTMLIIVKRYDKPTPAYGVHSNERGATHRRLGYEIFDALGLFDSEHLAEFINKYVEEHGELELTELPDLDTLINCAPIEWHRIMREGEYLDRFTAFTVKE